MIIPQQNRHEGRGINRAATHALELITSQGKLLLADARQCAGNVQSAAAFGAVAAVLAVGVVPTLIASAALLLADATRWSLGASLLAASSVVLFIVLVLGYAASRRGTEASDVLARSINDLEATLACLTPNNASSGESPPPSRKEK